MSKLKFLSDEWFTKVQELREAAGDLGLDGAMADLVLNITVTSDDGDIKMSLKQGSMEKGHTDGAPTTLSIPYELTKKMFIDQDQSAAMQAFMSGQIKIEGDMSKLMGLQSMQPNDKQIELQKQIMDMTEL